MTATTLAYVDVPVDRRTEHLRGDAPDFIDFLRKQAAQQLGMTVLLGAAKHVRVTSDDQPNSPVIHRWTIGIQRDLDAIEELERQLQLAREEGRAEAAAIIHDEAARHDRSVGPCGAVIVGALMAAAERIARK